jgi:hypothetical protein
MALNGWTLVVLIGLQKHKCTEWVCIYKAINNWCGSRRHKIMRAQPLERVQPTRTFYNLKIIFGAQWTLNHIKSFQKEKWQRILLYYPIFWWFFSKIIYIYIIYLWWRAFPPQTLKGLELIKVWSMHGAMLSPWTLPQI